MRTRRFPAAARLVLAALLVAAAPARAQTLDSLVRLLDAPDWAQRSRAVFLLGRVPLEELPADFAPRAIALLEREALRPITATEGYGRYLTELVDAVLRLDDARSLRGMALLGIQSRREAREFVAARGGEGLEPLEEAWRRGAGRDAVVETWAHMLTRPGVAPEDRRRVMARLFALLNEDPLHFARAAEVASLVEAVPVLRRLADRASDPPAHRAAHVLTWLHPLRERTAPADLLARLREWAAALCRGAEGAWEEWEERDVVCEEVRALTADAAAQAAEGAAIPARVALRMLLARANDGLRRGLLDDWEHALLIGSAAHAAGRL